MPRRITVFGAKAIALICAVVPAALVGVTTSALVGRVLLHSNGSTAARGYPAISLEDGPTLRAAVGTVAYFALIALFSLGVATALRHTATALAALLGVLYLTPILAQLVTNESWHTRIEKYAPMTAGLTVQATKDLDALPLAPWAGLGVMAAYSGVALLLGTVFFTLRDA